MRVPLNILSLLLSILNTPLECTPNHDLSTRFVFAKDWDILLGCEGFMNKGLSFIDKFVSINILCLYYLPCHLQMNARHDKSVLVRRNVYNTYYSRQLRATINVE